MKKQNDTHASHENTVIPIRENIDTMVNTAWQLTLNSLWPHMEEAVHDAQFVKKIIREKITSGKDPYQNYLVYCERILLCWKVMVQEYAFGQMEMPHTWFDPKNENGFKVSKIFHALLKKERLRNARANAEIKALAEAVLELVEIPNKINFNYWKNWFAEAYAYDEYILFYMCCIKNIRNLKK